METKTLTSLVIFGLGAVLFFGFGSTASADVTIPGMGSGAYDVPSVGGPGDSVDKAPVCEDRKSTRLNSSRLHLVCRLLLEKKKKKEKQDKPVYKRYRIRKIIAK